MKNKLYRVNEIFFSLQGEGFWTGTPMVFIRFSGCNLRCPFCDTDHSTFREMTASEIRDEVVRIDREVNRDNPWKDSCGTVCLTGGEPLMQLEKDLINALHEAGYYIHVETNGTFPIPDGIEWVTLSPKTDNAGVSGKTRVVVNKVSELKLVYDGSIPEERLEDWADFPCNWHFLQPCDTGDPVRNEEILRKTIDYVRQRGGCWRLSLQTHKLIGIR